MEDEVGEREKRETEGNDEEGGDTNGQDEVEEDDEGGNDEGGNEDGEDVEGKVGTMNPYGCLRWTPEFGWAGFEHLASEANTSRSSPFYPNRPCWSWRWKWRH